MRFPIFHLRAHPNEIYRHVGVKYFGWRDEEDGVLLELEDDAFREYKKQRKTSNTTEVDLENLLSEDYLGDVPSMEEIKQIMLAEKKKALLAKFSI